MIYAQKVLQTAGVRSQVRAHHVFQISQTDGNIVPQFSTALMIVWYCYGSLQISVSFVFPMKPSNLWIWNRCTNANHHSWRQTEQDLQSTILIAVKLLGVTLGKTWKVSCGMLWLWLVPVSTFLNFDSGSWGSSWLSVSRGEPCWLRVGLPARYPWCLRSV